MNNIMIDIETLGTTPGCVILSIGACEFGNGVVTKGFQAHINVHDSVKNGMTMSSSTVMWWMGQSDAARQAILGAETTNMPTALSRLSEAFIWDGKKVWCNGAAFDFPILQYAFDRVEQPKPWKYSSEMDMRTIKSLMSKEQLKLHTVLPDIAHDGLSDAIAQAKTLMEVMAHLKLKI